MIKTSYSTKLFFGKYNTKITIVTSVPSKKKYVPRYPKPKELYELHNWCKQELSHSFIIKDHFCSNHNCITYHQMIYTSAPEDKDKLVSAFGAKVSEITQPLNATHEQALDVKNLVVVRSHLLYHKYKYSVYFKYDPTHATWTWLKNFFKDETGYKLMPDPDSDPIYPVWPRVYLVDDTHLMSLKLMWQEKIDYVKSVELLP